MIKRVFSKKDILFLALFSIGFFSVSYATYKVVGILNNEETISLVKVLKETVSEFIS